MEIFDAHTQYDTSSTSKRRSELSVDSLMQSLIQRYHDELYFTAMTSSGRHWTLTKVLHTILCFMFITQKSHFCPVYIRHLSHLNNVILTGFLSPESAGGSFVSDWVLEFTLPATSTPFAVVECIVRILWILSFVPFFSLPLSLYPSFVPCTIHEKWKLLSATWWIWFHVAAWEKMK